MKPATPCADASLVLPRISPVRLALFAAYARHIVGRRFHALRVLRGARLQERPAPLVIYLNHAAWWDPLVCLLLARALLPGRASFAPIDAAMLQRYAFFRRLGFFGVAMNSPRGARVFLRTADAVLAAPGRALWLTPQGRFADVRERPPQLRDGLGVLAVRAPQAVFVPLAIEYAFWTEPRPEILVAFGEPVVAGAQAGRGEAEWTRYFSDALAAVQDQLAEHSCRRDPGDWELLQRGRAGVTPVYDAWGRLRAWLRGERFAADHLPEVRR